MNEVLQQRQRWFRSFPEGCIEFLLVTRVLGIFLLLALAAMRELQRPMVLLALGIVFLADYVLMIWWAVRTAVDLDHLSIRPQEASPSSNQPADTLSYAGPIITAAEAQMRCLKAVIPACLPPLVAFITLAPWPAFVVSNVQTRDLLARVLPAAGCAAFLAAVIIGQWSLQRIRLGPPTWTLLLLIPFVHWFAMHRLVSHFHQKLGECRRVQGESPGEGPSIALPIADATWLLAMLPWAILVVAGMSRASGLNWRDFVTPCGAFLTAVFAVADVATLEGFQRQLGATLKRLGSGASPSEPRA